MNSESPPQRGDVTGIDQCIENLRFVQATELVRSGKYLEAEAILSPKGQIPETARELDLLARINAHQERFKDAARYWQAALKKNPGNASYKNCLEQLSDIQSGNGLPNGERSTILRVGIGACVILLIIGLLYWSQRMATTPVKVTLIEEKPAQATPNTQSTTAVSQAATISEAATENQRVEQTLEQIQQTQKNQNQLLVSQIATIQTNQVVLLDGQTAARSQITVLGESIVELKRQQAETQHTTELTRSELATLTTARPLATSTAEITAAHLPNPTDFNPGTPGVNITTQSNHWLISFNPGLFDRDEHFKIGARARLKSVAKALVRTQAKFNVRIIGIAEDEPSTWPWSIAQTYEELGFLRAKSVLLYLRGLEILPSDKLSAVSGAANQRSFTSPNINNRSVVLEIAPD
jgi:putative N-acetylmannosamine-6-phosphate epimerase